MYQDLALCENLDVAANLSLVVVAKSGGYFARILRPLDDLEMEVRAQQAIAGTYFAICARYAGGLSGQRFQSRLLVPVPMAPL